MSPELNYQSHSELLTKAESFLQDQRLLAALELLSNREQAKLDHGLAELLHTPPAAHHYPHVYLWDSGFSQTMYAEAAVFCYQSTIQIEAAIDSADIYSQPRLMEIRGQLLEYSIRFIRAAEQEIFTVLKGQRPNGFIPNMQFTVPLRWFELERALVFESSHNSSNYTQPPILAFSTMTHYRAMKEISHPHADTFLGEVYDRLKRYYGYLEKGRSNSQKDKLIGVPNMRETGRDSDITGDHAKPLRLPRKGPETPRIIDEINPYIEVYYLLKQGIAARRHLNSENPEDHHKARKVFWMNDIMMNCLYVENLRLMAEMASERGKQDDALYFNDLAEEVESLILNDMWITDTTKVKRKGFYALDKKRQPVDEITGSNIFPLLLNKLSDEQLETSLDIFDSEIKVRFGMASASINSHEYGPNATERNVIWRGPVWIPIHFLIQRGLLLQAHRKDIRPDLRQRCQVLADWLYEVSNELLDISGAREHYHPDTAKGQRGRVENFSMSWLGRFMERPTQK